MSMSRRARLIGPDAGQYPAFERVLRLVRNAYASPEGREEVARDGGLVSPDVSARDLTRLFRRAGVTQFTGAVYVEHRRPVCPLVVRTLLRIMLIRATVKYGFQLLARIQDAAKYSFADQWAASHSFEVLRGRASRERKVVFFRSPEL